MADFVNILSGIAGVVGAVTGIISLIEVRKVKSIDLGIERSRLLNLAKVSLDDLKEVAIQSNQSRISTLVAVGHSQSGIKIKWEKQFDEKQAAIDKIAIDLATLNNKEVIYKELQEDISNLDLIVQRIKSLHAGFQSNIGQDDLIKQQLAQEKKG